MRTGVFQTAASLWLACVGLSLSGGQQPAQKINLGKLNVEPPPIAADKAVKYDYDIVYVRTPRDPKKKMMFTEANHPVHMDPGGDLMLLRPDGSEEVLVKGVKGRSPIRWSRSTANGSTTPCFTRSPACARPAPTSTRSTSSRERSFV